MGYIYDENLDAKLVVRLLPEDREWLRRRARQLRVSAGAVVRDAIRSERLAVQMQESNAA
jgi:hypothetical protein